VSVISKPRPARAASPLSAAAQLRETQDAFDSVAPDYDGARGNNELIQDMRAEMWRWLDAVFEPGSRLLDLGCGTGLDAVRLALRGHSVIATDWSAEMVGRTRDRSTNSGVSDRVQALAVGSHELQRLDGQGAYDGAYSNLGPLNCVPELASVSEQCARLLRPGGSLVFTVIGRYCPWEIAHYGVRRRWARAVVRFSSGVVPVGMNQRTIWTQYYTPKEFYKAFAKEFSLEHYRGMCVFAPPPYLTWLKDKYPGTYDRLWQLDRRVAGWPLIRQMGDHFLIHMKKR
jgi:SAM-dependent methyltransferase